jgi:hypothetical protein
MTTQFLFSWCAAAQKLVMHCRKFLRNATPRPEQVMQALQNKEAIERRNIAALAEEFAMPLAEVSAMYEAQRTQLMQGSKVGKFFSIFAVRNIRRQLMRQRIAKVQH